MTKKKQTKKPEEPEFDYGEFSIKFTKLSMKLSLIFIKLVYSLSKNIYNKIQVWKIDREIKKLDKEYTASKDRFDRREVK